MHFDNESLKKGSLVSEVFCLLFAGTKSGSKVPPKRGAEMAAQEAYTESMKKSVYALIDCNNFFVSCERLFRPDLQGKPVVVLSSNDGCAVSRSNEAKALGIPMGAPAFKYRDLFKREGVTQFSANFELYGDISRRITTLLTTVTPRLEVYSVDESFLELSELDITDYNAWGREVAARVLRYIGVPVSIGIAPTKTLAKLASDYAKKHAELKGALSLVEEPDTERILAAVPVENVWGIGHRQGPKLRAYGVSHAAQLAALTPRLARQLLGGVRGEQLVRELQGMSCFGLELEGRLAKSISRTRTFGEDTSKLHVLEAALASFATQAAYRLRRSEQLTRRASIFLTTSRHKPNYRRWTREVKLPLPTADTGHLIRVTTELLGELYDPSASYHRAGVLLYDFVPEGQLQSDLLGLRDFNAHHRSTARMRAIDRINKSHGRNHLHYAAEDLARGWAPRRLLQSPRYTSAWDELPSAAVQI